MSDLAMVKISCWMFSSFLKYSNKFIGDVISVVKCMFSQLKVFMLNEAHVWSDIFTTHFTLLESCKETLQE